MAQTNVMVTYAPARRPVAPAAERDRARDGRKRWGAALTGVLLAGGAVFALGTFVRPDGSLRDTGLPSPARIPLAKANRAPATEIASPLPEARVPEAPSSALPYLALVRDVAPAPAPPMAARRPLAAPAVRDATRPVRRTAMRVAVESASAAEESPAETVALVPPPTPAPLAGQRRDLKGFLGEQGLVLAVPPQPSEGLAPVAEWTPDEVAAAGIETASPVPPPTAALAADEAVALAPSDVGTIAAIELPEPDPVADTAGLIELPARAAPEPAPVADVQRLAGIESVVIVPVAIEPATTANRDDSAETAPRLAVASAPVLPGAGITEAPAAVYAQSFPLAVVNGESLGGVTLRDLGPQGQAVHLGALVGLLKLRMPEAEFAWLSSAAAADQFVTLDRLRAAGIAIQFDARDGRLLIDAR